MEGIQINFTNKYSLPHEVYEALSKSSYSAGESNYSATSLLKPPQQLQLERRYAEHLTEDVMDRCWSMFGEAVHNIFEQHTHEEAEAETRLYVDILDRKIGGKFDNYRDGTITDFKVTSAWTLVYGSRVTEWEEQLNIYAYILRQNKYHVDKLRIVAVLRDHDKNKAKQDHKYPQVPVIIIPLELWSDEKAEAFIYEKVYEHVEAEKLTDECLPCCSKEDMWEQASKYAVMKEGRKTAVRVFDTEEEANSYLHIDILDHRPEQECYYTVVTRQGKRTRCEDGYCSVVGFCCQHRKHKEEHTA